MVAPGALETGHRELATDCFACHSALRGVSPEKCITCHAPKEIGLRTTKGIAIASKGIKSSFHQDLIEQNCISCHSDHAGPKLTKAKRKPFSHALLKPQVQEQCQNCHKIPNTQIHNKVTGDCKQCHSQIAWKPATFEHDKLFRLDGDHKTECITCHVQNIYSTYTCYGCHEHQADKIRAKHQREGIKNFENSVKCHRSSDDKEGEGGDEGND